MSVWDKLDSALASIYSNFLQVQQHGRERVARVHPVVAGSGALHVTLQYTGDLAAIEAAGFRTTWRAEPHRAGGVIELAELERIAALPGVFKLSYGHAPKPHLDKSVPDIRADQVWSRTGDIFGGVTGKGVIVGVIDTGIDFEHPFFLKQTPAKTTRILRIWDLGLAPQGDERSPDPARLFGSPTYGVEYTEQMINSYLRNEPDAMVIRHRDCAGHGTHVSSIAAGNGQPDHKYVGVAPEADIIMVKYLSPEAEPQVGGNPVDNNKQMFDAVSYILNVAAVDYGNRPVVINCSFGRKLGPHDGFSETEDFLTFLFVNRPGQILVAAAGNEGGGGKHAYIELGPGTPDGGSKEIPLQLYDSRTKPEDYDTCQWVDQTDDVAVELYYPTWADVSFAVQVPGSSAFKAGPPLGGTESDVKIDGGPQTYDMIHKRDDQLLRTGITVRRNFFRLVIKHYKKKHRTGRYVVKVTTADSVTIHLWCEFGDYGLLLDRVHAEPNDTRFDISAEGGAANIITVAAYDAESAGLPVPFFSSRGPLVLYDPLAPDQPSKPDLAAPGKSVDAAHSQYMRPKQKKTETIAFDGTSMAAPHVAGVVALMLQKAPTLSVAEALAKLREYCRPSTTTDEVGAGRLDAKATVDHTP